MIDLTVYAGARSTTPTARDALAWEAFTAEVEAQIAKGHRRERDHDR